MVAMKPRAALKVDSIRRGLAALARRRPEFIAVYLFGSQANGKAGPLSDVDVAILLDGSRVPAKLFFKLRLELIAEASHVCRRDDVDVVLLNEATPLLAYEAVRGGELLYERDHSARVSFEARAVQQYLDLEPFYRVGRHYLKRQLLSARHG